MPTNPVGTRPSRAGLAGALLAMPKAVYQECQGSSAVTATAANSNVR
jgi:hypothetical protein